MDDIYFSIAKDAEGIYKDKGSKFIGIAKQFSQEENLKSILDAIKKEHSTARHFCYAYRLGINGEIFRANDDGEPAGSAGKPILNTLLSAQITNVLVVVVRYFGGTLLGVPGLINAYKEASFAALANAEKKECIAEDIYTITFDYVNLNAVMKIIKEAKIQIGKQIIDQICTCELIIRKQLKDEILLKLNKHCLQIQYIKTL